jgi:hypothetical protein
VSASPIMSRTSMKRKHVVDIDRVEDSEDFDHHIPSSDDDNGLAIHAKPLDSCPPLRAEKRVLQILASMLRKLCSN